MSRKKLSLFIILLVVINIISLTAIHIPLGDGPDTIIITYDVNKNEYGYYVNNTWVKVFDSEMDHPHNHQQFFRRYARIKDRWSELLYA